MLYRLGYWTLWVILAVLAIDTATDFVVGPDYFISIAPATKGFFAVVVGAAIALGGAFQDMGSMEARFQNVETQIETQIGDLKNQYDTAFQIQEKAKKDLSDYILNLEDKIKHDQKMAAKIIQITLDEDDEAKLGEDAKDWLNKLQTPPR